MKFPGRGRAFTSWREKSFADRAATIKRMTALLRERQNELAELLTREGVDFLQGYAFGRPSLAAPWVDAPSLTAKVS